MSTVSANKTGSVEPVDRFPLRWVLFVLIPVVVLDQASKYFCNAVLEYAQPQQVFPGFDLLLVYNTGAAFSFLSTAGGWQRWILALVSVLVCAVLLVWLRRLKREQWLLGFALALILGGALGNLYDRIVLGHVIDFISVYVADWRFATFNIADSAISVGAVLLALDTLFGKGETSNDSQR